MIKKFLIAFGVVLSLFSCKGYLDIKPKSQIKEGTLFEKERGFIDALTGIYTLMAKRSLYGDNLTMSFLDVLAQRYRVPDNRSPYWNMANYNYTSDDATKNEVVDNISVKATIRTIWLSQYTCIANANNILENMDKNRSVFTSGNYDMVKGEALAIRAFIHFDLLRMFGPMMSVNRTAKSIPYRTAVSRDVSPLLPADEVMKRIIEDLLTAEALLKNDPLVSGSANDYYDFQPAGRKFHINYFGVQAALARAYLYNNEPEKAYAYAKKVIASDKYAFVTDVNASVADACRDRTYFTEQVFSLMINDMKEYTDRYFNISSLGVVQYNTYTLTNDDNTINALFDNSSSEYRLQFLFEYNGAKLWPAKYKQFEGIKGQVIGTCINNFPKNVVPVMRVSEMYYIAAECAPELSESVTLLNEVVTHRGLDPVTGITDKASLQNALTKEYQKEFFSEGQLFYYYKRKAFTTIPGTNGALVADSKIYVLPIPEDELIFNP